MSLMEYPKLKPKGAQQLPQEHAWPEVPKMILELKCSDSNPGFWKMSFLGSISQPYLFLPLHPHALDSFY